MGNNQSDSAKALETINGAIGNNDLDEIKKIVGEIPANEICKIEAKIGINLLKEAIRRKRKEIFDYILQLFDTADLETIGETGDTLLESVLSSTDASSVEFNEYCALELIKKGSHLHSEDKQGNLLVLCVTYDWVNITKFLLTQGFDPNATDDHGNTALHKVVIKEPVSPEAEELITTLLCSGAEPFVGSLGQSDFEMSVKNQHSEVVQEMLFLYTFDKLAECKVQVEVLLVLAENRSKLFFELFEQNVKFVFGKLSPEDWFNTLYDLLYIDLKYLRFLIEKRCSYVEKILRLGVSALRYARIMNDPLRELVQGVEPQHRTRYYLEQILRFDQIVEKMDTLMQTNPKMYNLIIDLISNLETYVILQYIASLHKKDENTATELLIFLTQYGIQIYDFFVHLIYSIFGYCLLFKFFLHVNFVKNTHFMRCGSIANVMASVISDLQFDFNQMYDNPRRFFKLHGTEELLDYFVDLKLQRFLLLYQDQKQFSQETVARIKRHPKVPLLVQIARDVFRKFLIDMFDLQRSKDFYCIVNGLPISSIQKKIITFETKLYRD